MSEELTMCDKCQSLNFTDINPEARESLKTLVTVRAKCNDCGQEFEYSDFSNRGQELRNKGMIW